MIHAPIALGLAGAGVLVGVWRHRVRQRRRRVQFLKLQPVLAAEGAIPAADLHAPADSVQSVFRHTGFDDLADLSHAHRVAMYAVAVSAAGFLFYAPLGVAALPVLGYSASNWGQVHGRRRPERRLSPQLTFEALALLLTLGTQRWLLASIVFAVSFATQKWALTAGNVLRIGLATAEMRRTAFVWVLRDDSEVAVRIREVAPGDRVVAHAGDLIAFEGVVLTGSGFVDQQALTGCVEAVPKEPGDRVFPFTRVRAGNLTIRIR